MERQRYFTPVMKRSRLMLEVTSELVAMKEWPFRQVRLSLRQQEFPDWKLCLFASDAPDVIQEVAQGNVDVAIINPTEPLTLAYRGTGPFKEPMPVRAIAVLPSLDQLGFTVTERTGLKSLYDIRERRFPLRLSLRGQRNHSIHIFVKQVLDEIGFSLDDIVRWGGELRYDHGMPATPGNLNRLGAVQRGEIDAIFDEAVRSWGDTALDMGMRFLPLEEPLLRRLEALGFRRATLRKDKHPRLPADIPTLDFSGWTIFTRADVPDNLITSFCAALDARKESIPWEGEGPLALDRFCRDTPEGPLDIPLHPAAERYWREKGYLA